MAMEVSQNNIPNQPFVQIIKSISVYPNSDYVDGPNKIVSLSNLDRQCPALMYIVFFFNKSSNKDLSFDSIFDRLKASLEATLSICYPAGGRLQLSSPDHLDICCNNSGAVLVQAESKVKISELGDLSLYNDFFEKLVFKPVISNISDMPLVAAQVTKFDCGGYSIGVGGSHSLFDGISAYEVLTVWAAHSQGSDPMYIPVHERGTLLLENEHKSLKSDETISTPTAIEHLYQLITQASPDDQPHENLVFNTFHLSTESIENLKRKVIEEKRDDVVSCSTFDLLAAHLWKVRTKSLGLERDKKVCLQFAVDARKRMVPPLPQGFSGNAYVLASVLLTAGELDELSYESIIHQIKEAKNSVTHDYVKAYIKALEGPQATLPPLPELTVVSDWTRVPFHRINFLGENAAYASPLIPPVPQVAYFMQNPDEHRAVDVRIGLLPKMQAAFSNHFINTL